MAEGTEYKSHAKEYLIIFFILIALTIIELVIPGMKNLSYAARASSLILLAIGKAFIVAYYYMHVKEETRWLKFIAAVPISAAIYAIVVILESIYR